ncbi:hypothetical protein LRP52_01340 [Photobacterium sp. ZSDE20]|uniref:Uncharacterized protein n=1 Tax=Photobacterium pectinilyticum TaxID=2906793 RepID=A0ABT1MW96_9GAMM|nr:hypothetical protein [Photobacterium sp. ZSDE20]MCQ1056768.1 hypothetical protein [Photobacterium sp. ZSDE20]MDD1820845.1 hypothetical protein [Photobacterium sp. ZSDE20]
MHEIHQILAFHALAIPPKCNAKKIGKRNEQAVQNSFCIAAKCVKLRSNSILMQRRRANFYHDRISLGKIQEFAPLAHPTFSGRIFYLRNKYIPPQFVF